jgi:hypothetical protein
VPPSALARFFFRAGPSSVAASVSSAGATASTGSSISSAASTLRLLRRVSRAATTSGSSSMSFSRIRTGSFPLTSGERPATRPPPTRAAPAAATVPARLVTGPPTPTIHAGRMNTHLSKATIAPTPPSSSSQTAVPTGPKRITSSWYADWPMTPPASSGKRPDVGKSIPWRPATAEASIRMPTNRRLAKLALRPASVMAANRATAPTTSQLAIPSTRTRWYAPHAPTGPHRLWTGELAGYWVCVGGSPGLNVTRLTTRNAATAVAAAAKRSRPYGWDGFCVRAEVAISREISAKVAGIGESGTVARPALPVGRKKKGGHPPEAASL